MVEQLRAVVVGAGPAGLYAAEALVEAGARVDVLERLPAPYGLVRYGVAPDHLKMKSTIRVFENVLSREGVRFLGNVSLGEDLTTADLQRHYDAVVVASGAAKDRRLGIPGEELPGSFSATEFVNWYNGHPDAAIDHFTLMATDAVVIGVGNVALDVARLLAKSQADLDHTDVPPHVHDVFEASAITDIHLVGRRGAAYAKFTTKELKELGEIEGVDVIVDPADVPADGGADDAAVEVMTANRVAARNYDVMRGWSERVPSGAPRRVHVRFGLRPHSLVAAADGTVAGVRFERAGDGEIVEVSAQLVLRSVGYLGSPVPGLPFDEGTGTVPHEAGRVVLDGVAQTGLYVAGWIKRGPTGIIGTNKSDAHETVAAVLADAEVLLARRSPGHATVPDLADELRERGVRVVTWEGWQRIDGAEIALGASRGRDRTKLHDLGAMLDAAGH